MKYSYQVLGETYEFSSNYAAGVNVANAAASDFHSNHNGWECSRPLEFEIHRIGRYSIERESEPVFYAYGVKEKPDGI